MWVAIGTEAEQDQRLYPSFRKQRPQLRLIGSTKCQTNMHFNESFQKHNGQWNHPKWSDWGQPFSLRQGTPKKLFHTNKATSLKGPESFNPIQAFVTPLTYITAYLENGLEFGVTAWSIFFLCIFLSESSAPPISPHVCCHGNHTTNRLFLKTGISNVFRLF